MKKRINRETRVVFGFTGILQDDLERYQGVAEVAAREGWQLLGIHEQVERSFRQLVLSDAVDAGIGDFISDSWLGDLPSRLPLVHLGRHPLSNRVSAAAVDGAAVGRLAAQHLSGAGYERFFAMELPGNPAARAQSDAFVEALALGDSARLRNSDSLWAQLDGANPTGVLCFTDFQARGVLAEAVRRGVAVPDKLGVLGVGNRFWDRVVAERDISSIPLPQRMLGARAAELLRERLEGRPPRTVWIPPGRVIPRESTLRSRHPGRLAARVEGMFRGRLADPPTMDEVSRWVGMSRRAFELRFQQETGTTPYARLLEMRMEESKRLLLHTEWSVARVGESVGIEEPSRFNAFFRHRAGESPGRWRQNAGTSSS